MKAAELQALYSAAKITYSIYRFLDDNMAQFLQEQIDVDLQSAGEFMSRGEYSNALTLLVRAHTGAEKVLKRSWSFWGIDKDKYKECYLTATYVAVCYRALGKKDNASIYVDKALDYFDKYSKAYIDGFSTESGGMNFGPPGMRNPIRGFSDEERSEAKREMAEEKARIKKLPKQVASLK